MIGLILTFSVAKAGLLDSMGPGDRHLGMCRIAAEEAEAAESWDRLWGIWKACLAESKRLGFTELQLGLEGEVAVSQALLHAAPMRVADPHRWALEVLSEASRWATAEFPTDIVRRTFRAWMETDEGRAYVEPVRHISVTWETHVDPVLEQVIRRYVEDAGLKWATPGDPRVDTAIAARLDVRTTGGESSAQGQLVLSTSTFSVSRIKIKDRAVARPGFKVQASAEAPDATEATDTAVRSVADSASQRLLLRVLAALFER